MRMIAIVAIFKRFSCVFTSAVVFLVCVHFFFLSNFDYVGCGVGYGWRVLVHVCTRARRRTSYLEGTGPTGGGVSEYEGGLLGRGHSERGKADGLEQHDDGRRAREMRERKGANHSLAQLYLLQLYRAVCLSAHFETDGRTHTRADSNEIQ